MTRAARIVGLLMLLCAALVISFYWLVIIHSAPDERTVPDWASASSQPDRSVTMDLRLNGKPDDLNAEVDYELQLSADDELVPRIQNGEINSDELATYLAGGSANTPITVDRTDGNPLVVARFHFIGAEDDLYLGEKWELDCPAAAANVSQAHFDCATGHNHLLVANAVESDAEYCLL